MDAAGCGGLEGRGVIDQQTDVSDPLHRVASAERLIHGGGQIQSAGGLGEIPGYSAVSPDREAERAGDAANGVRAHFDFFGYLVKAPAFHGVLLIEPVTIETVSPAGPLPVLAYGDPGFPECRLEHLHAGAGGLAHLPKGEALGDIQVMQGGRVWGRGTRTARGAERLPLNCGDGAGEFDVQAGMLDTDAKRVGDIGEFRVECCGTPEFLHADVGRFGAGPGNAAHPLGRWLPGDGFLDAQSLQVSGGLVEQEGAHHGIRAKAQVVQTGVGVSERAGPHRPEIAVQGVEA
ncbi:hypothetical protein EES47_28865 [Streptomyces sp. ADI98-12]|nr:hypothetical protein EES47_28865 [Streptomyces sp. ADI98-12]